MPEYEQSRAKVNTSSFTLFNEENVMLKLAYLDDFSLSVVIGASDMSNGKRTYPKDKRESFIITIDRAAALYDIIFEKVLPAIRNDENYDGGVLLSKRKDSLFQIRVQDGEVYAVYLKNIDANRHPGATYVYKFSKIPVIENYNPETSQFESRHIHAHFTLFIKFLEAAVLMGAHASTHSYRYANKYITDIILNTLKSMAAKMGVTIETYTPSGNQQSSNSGFELPFDNATNPPIEEVDSFDGIFG